MPSIEPTGASAWSGPSIPLGPFRLDRCIGRGGMAEVWSGVHTAQGVPVAVKVMTGERAREPSFRTAFRNEVQSVASLDHPGIVIVFDHGEIGADGEEAARGLLTAGSPTLAMELADGGTLGSHFNSGIEWSQLRRVILELLDALAHAHARGVVHRDLKPNNILVFRNGAGTPRFKLADFGLAQAVELQTRNDSTEVICGTPTYMAPEQLRGHWRNYGPWTDLYSLGCLAWTLATGRPPFGGAGLLETIRLQMEEEAPAFVPRTPVPRGFEGWLRRMLQKDPGHRFVRAADATGALRDLTGPPLGPAQAGAALEVDEPTTHSISISGLWPPEPRDGAAPPAISPAAEAPIRRRSPPLPPTWEPPAVPKPSLKLIGAGLGLYGLRSIPLLGRRAERDALWQALGDVHAERQARLVLLRGPAGNGKTHLAEWTAERAHEVGGAIVLRAYHGPNPGAEDGLPRMMARHLRCVGLTRQEILERTKVLMSGRKVDDPAEWSGLTDLMAPAGSRQTAPERFALLERHFQRLARQRPVLVLLDDVHWSAESLGLARFLLERRNEEPVPVLLLLTVRDEVLAERPAEAEILELLTILPGAETVVVPPLPAEDRATLTREILGLADDLAAQVDARTAGNPLFAVQLVGDWLQRDILEIGDTGFALRPGAEARIPDDLHQVWSDRVARLLTSQPAGAREALEIAATLSPFVDGREWEAACRAAGIACPPGLLDALVASRLAARTEEGWSFVHAMLRETIERLAREGGRFAAHNLACAAMLQPRAAAGERGVAERLGRHLLLAGERAAALEPLLAGARERRGTSDYPAAQALVEEREGALRELGIADSDPRWGEGWVIRARIHLHQGELEEVFRWAERATAAGDPGSDAWGPIRSEALRLLGDAARRRGDLDRAAGLYERCIAVPDNPHSAAASFWGLGDVARQRGRPAEATSYFDRAVSLYREIGDQHGVADHGIGLADLARQRRELTRAGDLYRQTCARFEVLGNRYGVARSLNGLGDVARFQGDLDAAIRRYRRSLTILDGLRSADAIFPRLNLALIDLAEQRFTAAEQTLEEARATLEHFGWGGLLSCVDVALLACAAQAREWSRWDDCFERAGGALRESGLLDPDVAWAAELAGRLTDWAGQSTRAREAFALALAQWSGLGDAEGAQRLQRALGPSPPESPGRMG